MLSRLGVVILLAFPFIETVQSQTVSYRQLIWLKSKNHSIDPHLLMAIVEAESNGNPDAISTKDCRGLAQLNIFTARMYDPYLTRRDLHDIETNLEIAARHIRDLQRLVIQKFPNIKPSQRNVLIAAAYNAGWSSVERYGIPPFTETRKYIRKVMKFYMEYSKQR